MDLPDKLGRHSAFGEDHEASAIVRAQPKNLQWAKVSAVKAEKSIDLAATCVTAST